jgi:hypothetical protein
MSALNGEVLLRGRPLTPALSPEYRGEGEDSSLTLGRGHSSQRR